MLLWGRTPGPDQPASAVYTGSSHGHQPATSHFFPTACIYGAGAKEMQRDCRYPQYTFSLFLLLSSSYFSTEASSGRQLVVVLYRWFFLLLLLYITVYLLLLYVFCTLYHYIMIIWFYHRYLLLFLHAEKMHYCGCDVVSTLISDTYYIVYSLVF